MCYSAPSGTEARTFELGAHSIGRSSPQADASDEGPKAELTDDQRVRPWCNARECCDPERIGAGPMPCIRRGHAGRGCAPHEVDVRLTNGTALAFPKRVNEKSGGASVQLGCRGPT